MNVREDEKGFIIIEAMVALLVMGVALFVMGLLINANQRNAARSAQRNQSTLDIIEFESRQVRALPFSSVALSSGAPSDAGWVSHKLDKSEGEPIGGGTINPTGTVTSATPASVLPTDYDRYSIYRYVYCGAVGAQYSACSVKRVRIVLETKGVGATRPLPPDGLSSREVIITQSSSLPGVP